MILYYLMELQILGTRMRHYRAENAVDVKDVWVHREWTWKKHHLLQDKKKVDHQ